MGTVRRFRDIVNSHLNSMLDKAEDPEKMVKLMIQEMDDSLIELKRSCSEKVALKVQLAKELDVIGVKINQWQERAEMAVAKGKDVLAREAIQAKQKLIEEKGFREKEADHVSRIIDETTSEIAQIESKMEEVQQKYRLLIQRGIHAVEKKQVKKIMKEATGAKVLTRFDQLEGRIERMEAEAEMSGRAAPGTFDRDFVEMEREAKIDEELAALKSKVKPAAKKTASPSKEEKEA